MPKAYPITPDIPSPTRIETPKGSSGGKNTPPTVRATPAVVTNTTSQWSATGGSIDVADKFYFNPEQKKVILYIDKPLGKLSPRDMEKINKLNELGVTVVNSLEELGKVIK